MVRKSLLNFLSYHEQEEDALYDLMYDFAERGRRISSSELAMHLRCSEGHILELFQSLVRKGWLGITDVQFLTRQSS